jgi:hypothetical protein
MLEYELDGKIYTEQDLINEAGGKDKLSAYIKSKGFKVATKKAKPSTKTTLTDSQFGFDKEGKYTQQKEQFSELNKTKKKKPTAITPGVNDFGAKIENELKPFNFKETGKTKEYKAIEAAKAQEAEKAKNEIKPRLRPLEIQKEKAKKEESGFLNYLGESFDQGISTLVQSFYKIPEFTYDVAATITNPIGRAIGKLGGVEVEDASSERIMNTLGIKNVPAEILQKRINESNKIIKDYSDKNGADPLTAIENGNYLGAAKLVAGGTVQSSPMMAAAILSGGSSSAMAGIATSSAISKAEQLKIENPEMDVQTRTTNAAVAGVLEGYLGQLFTGASGAVVKKIIMDKGAKAGAKIISNGIVGTVEKAIEKSPMIGVLGEIAEESAVELGNQLNDINSGIRTELDYRQITNAGIIATGMAGTNTVPIYAAKGYMKATEYNKVKQVNKEINGLTTQLSNPYISAPDKKIIAARVNRLIGENKAIVGTSLEKVEALPENVKTELNTLNTGLDDLKSKYLELVDNTDLPVDVKKAMGSELALQAKEIQDRKTSIIEGNYIYEDFKKLPEAEQNRIKVLANETLVADSELTDNPKTKFNEDEIKREAINIYNAEIRAGDVETDVQRTKTAAKALGLSEDLDMPELNTANDVITYLSENTNLDENTIDELADSYGAFIPLSNGKEALIINKEAANMDQVVTTGQHEFLHKLIYKAVKDNPNLQKKIGTDLYEHLEKYIGTEDFNNTEFKSRYDTYKADFESTKATLENKVKKAKDYFERGLIKEERYNQAITEADQAVASAEGKYLEETLPLLSESLTKGDIKYNETFFTKIGDILRRVFQKYGLSKVKFNTGKDVFNFVKDYNKSFEKGQFTKAFKALAKEGQYKGSIAKGNAPVRAKAKTTVKKSQPLSQVESLKKQLKDIQDNEFDYDPDDFDQQVANLQNKIKKAVEKEKTAPPVETKKEVTEEEADKEIIKNERSSLSSDKVQKIYDDKGVNGAQDIIDLFRPITKKLVNRRMDAPGFDRELLTDEIETGTGGILDLITKYKPESGIPLAAFINKYLPVRAIAASRRVLDKDFSKDVTEEKGLMAEETVSEIKEKPKYKNALESNVFDPEALETAKNKIITVVRTLKSKIDEPISLNRTVTPIIAEIRDEIGKQLDIDLKTAMGGKKDDQLKKWLVKNKRYVLENMTTTWLMGKDGQGGIPQAIQKQIDGRWVNYPDWVGKKIDRETTSTDLAGRTSGAELVRRLPSVANNVSEADYLSQILEPSGNPIRGRKESLAKAIAEEAAFDIINKDFEDGGPIFEAFKANQERLGVYLKDNVTNEFAKQAERGNVKFSKKLIKGFEISQNKLGKDISNAETITDEIKVINNWIASDGRSIRTLAFEIGKGLKQFTTNRGLFENIILPIIKTYSKFEGIVGENSYKLGKAEKGESIYFGETKVPLWADTTVIKKNWEGFVNKIDEEAVKATNELINVVKYFKDNNQTKEDFESYLALLRWDQRSLIRKVSKSGIGVLELNRSQEPRLEHNPPVQNIVEKTIDLFEGKISEKEFRQFIDKAKVNLVPKALEDMLPNYIESENRMYDTQAVLYLQDLIDKGFKITGLEKEYGSKAKFNSLVKLAKSGVTSKANIQNSNNIIAINSSLPIKYSKSPKGISVFDFDDTVGLTKGNVLYMMPDGSTGKLNAEEFAKEGSNLLSEGAVFDFSEFSKVVEGKPGPMVEKMKKMIGKFGPDNFFILTARPADAAVPIHEFLSSIGINIPLENITGLGNSAAQAKADWIVGKAAEGYNDFYFADDAPQNVKAVQDALDVLDVKSKIQQAKLKFSKSMSARFNEIIEENKGVESYKVYSDITARRRGLKKNRFDLYVPPSAADFELLLYNFMGKGALGESQKEFFEDALIKPYINGVNLMDAVRQSIKREYKALLKSFPEIKKELEKLTPNKDFTYDQAMRVAIWDQFNVEIPGLSQRDRIYLSDLINNDPDLAAFKDGLIVMGRQKDGWLPPGTYWDADTIISDLYNITEGSGRKKFLGEFIENVEELFGTWSEGMLVGPNMNKIEAVYGTNVREALEDSIYRMTNGKNRSFGQDRETTAWNSWVNGSTGAIMFLNTRSAVLQMLGAVNFLNWRDNNPYNAGKAFLNQPQYWKDFARIWNSDKLKERRGGLREDVASAEIANAAAGSKNKVVAVTSYLLKIGYTPTQLADSFAIASGGAPFYRNRINSYLKEGLTEQEAENKAWQDFSKISDETQQSGDPKDISKQQSSAAGRLLLVFQNFTMQQSRIVKKAALDLKNGRGDAKTNIAKIAYYLAVQNIMFSTLQQGIFATFFDDDEEEDKKAKTKKEAAYDVANGVLDSILRGTGFLGGVVSTLKNTVVKYLEERAKKQKAEYAKVVLEFANMSPPIGSKLRKTYSSLQQTKYDKDLIEERGWGVMQDGRVHLGPMYSVTGKLVEVGTNFPMDRLVNKVENVSQAFNSENTTMQRIATGLGYSPWTVGIEGTKGDILIKEAAKEKRKEEGTIKAKETRKENAERLKDSIKSLSPEERMKYRRAKALEKREKRIEKAKEKREERRKKMEMINKLNANK